MNVMYYKVKMQFRGAVAGLDIINGPVARVYFLNRRGQQNSPGTGPLGQWT